MPQLQRREILKRVSSAALKYWKDLAKAELRSTRNVYVRSLKRTYLSSSKAVISLVGDNGPIPFLVEMGYESPDHGRHLLASRRAKTDKSGRRYIDIYSDRFNSGRGGFLRYSERSKPWPLRIKARNFSDRVIRAIPTFVNDIQ